LRLHRIAIGLIAAALAVGALTALPASADAGGASGSPRANARSSASSVPDSDAAVCSPDVPAGYAYCHAHVRTDSNAVGHVPTRPDGHRADPNVVGNSGAYDPMYLESAYDDPAYAFSTSTGTYGTSTVGSKQLVAIVDAYDASSVTSDLAYYRNYFGLPACPLTAMPPAGSRITAGSGCSFYKVNQNGVEGSYPSANSGWAQEISLDVDMVSAMCPNCSILLVEANSNSMANLGASVNKAVALGATVVSNSYGGSEYSSETSDASSYYNHPGVAVVASSGDNGYGVEFPAAAGSVTSVGGTTLTQATNSGTRNGSESAWSGAGSGCSAYVTKPSWQQDGGCARRTVADVSAVADPNTGVWVYDRGWYVFGGTSVASPIIGSMFAVGNALNGTNGATPQAWPYSDQGALYDVTSGSNGSCSGSYLCTAVSGYDGPTGLGTPLGSAAFTGAAPTPTVPSAPTNLTASPGDTTVSLSWSAPTNSGGSAVTYSVYRSSGTSSIDTSETAKPVMSGLTATTYTDQGLTDGTQYNYQVVAVNSTGPSPASNEASATPAPLPAPPGAPLNLSAVPGSPHGVTLSWTLGSGGAPTSYKIYRGTRSNKYTSVWSVTPSGCSTTCTYTDTSTKSGTSYYYRVAAVNSAGTSSQSNQAGPVRAD
jgi:subtilase family serine protease